MPFKPGQSGNPAGRPKGSKQKLATDFVRALADDFAKNGAAAIERTRDDDPAGYLRIIASVLPKEFVIREEMGVADLPDDELAAIATGRGAGTAESPDSASEPAGLH